MSFIQDVSGTNLKKDVLLRSVIGFISPVGGTGTTTVATSIAHILAKIGYSVCFIDTNIVFPNAYTYLVKPEVLSETKYDLLNMGEKDIKDFIMKGRHDNIHVISCKSRKLLDLLSSRDSQQHMKVLIKKCKTSFDFIIFDISRDPTEISSAALVYSDIVYQVWDESPSCFTNTKQFMSYLIEMGTYPSKIMKVIINKRTGVNLPVKMFNTNSLRVVTTIPYSLQLLSSSWSGKVVGEIESTKRVDSQVAQSMTDVVKDILGTEILENIENYQVEVVREEGKKKKLFGKR